MEKCLYIYFMFPIKRRKKLKVCVDIQKMNGRTILWFFSVAITCNVEDIILKYEIYHLLDSRSWNHIQMVLQVQEKTKLVMECKVFTVVIMIFEPYISSFMQVFFEKHSCFSTFLMVKCPVFPFALPNALKHSWALNLTKSIVSRGMLVNHIIKDKTWALYMGGTIGILEQEIHKNKQSGKL